MPGASSRLDDGPSIESLGKYRRRCNAIMRDLKDKAHIDRMGTERAPHGILAESHREMLVDNWLTGEPRTRSVGSKQLSPLSTAYRVDPSTAKSRFRLRSPLQN
jgi:hypothetical protein